MILQIVIIIIIIIIVHYSPKIKESSVRKMTVDGFLSRLNFKIKCDNRKPMSSVISKRRFVAS